MTKVSFIRIFILIILIALGLIGIFAIPVDDSPSWFSDLFLSKAFGAGCFWISHRLYNRWRRSDRILKAYHKWNEAKN